MQIDHKVARAQGGKMILRTCNCFVLAANQLKSKGLMAQIRTKLRKKDLMKLDEK